jgi:hypothetical protein
MVHRNVIRHHPTKTLLRQPGTCAGINSVHQGVNVDIVLLIKAAIMGLVEG